MSIIKYINGKFNCGQALKDGWGLDWSGEDNLIGLVLVDRKRPNHIVTIAKYDWFGGIFRVYFKEGGWLCFDHCINQFKLSNSKNEKTKR